MIKLSKRLSVIAGMINNNNNNVLADIGCDHALLDIYLLQNKKIKKVIACDIKEGALNQAKKNIKLYNIKNIETRLSDGLEKVNTNDKVDVLVLSGLGDVKIINILKKDLSKLKHINSIIIQSNTGVDKIREYLVSINYLINEEVLVEENNIIYSIINFEKGSKKYTKKEIMYGPLLLKEKNELFKKLISNNITSNNKIISKLNYKNMFKKIKLKINNIYLKNLIK